MNDEKKIVESLKNRISEKGFSQKKIAELLGKERENVNKMLNFKNSMTFSTMVKLCNATGIKIWFDDEE